jgi:hypothetical protein
MCLVLQKVLLLHFHLVNPAHIFGHGLDFQKITICYDIVVNAKGQAKIRALTCTANMSLHSLIQQGNDREHLTCARHHGFQRLGG